MENEGNKLGLTFDYKIVGIDEVIPNTWNPKKDNPERYAEVVNSIKTYGLKAPITVREKDGKYEIIDGFHRHKACKELGFDKVIINNLGAVSDSEARRLTIVFQKVNVPFDELMYAQLLKNLLQDMNEEDLLKSIPIKEPELEGYLKMAEFDAEKEYGEQKDLNEAEVENMRGLTIIFTEGEADIVRKAINEIKNQSDDMEMSNSRAIELICADFLAGSIPDDKPEK